MNRINTEAAVITHIGPSKQNNEDNYYVNGAYKSDSTVSTDGLADKKIRNSYTYAVCDGLGGESYGELSSLIAAATLEKFKETNIRLTINRYLKTVNDFIHDLILKNKNKQSGTTLALLDIRESTAIAYSVGNSSVYLCRKGNLYLLSSDKTGSSNEPEQYLGAPGATVATPFISKEIDIRKDDIFMLCTVGLTSVLSNEDIIEILSQEDETAISLTKKLVSASEERYGKEDVTVIVVRVF